MILFTKSTAVLHKYLNDELKILWLLQVFPDVAQNSLRIPWVFHVQKNPRVFQVFAGLWPPCFSITQMIKARHLFDCTATLSAPNQWRTTHEPSLPASCRWRSWATTTLHREPDMRRYPEPQHLWWQSFCSCQSCAMEQFTATSQRCWLTIQ